MYGLKLDLQMFAQEKTEQATPRKKQEARRKGQVAKSSDLPGALIMLFSFLALYMFGGMFEDSLYSLFTVPLREYMLWDVTIGNIAAMFVQLAFQVLMFIAPILIIALILGIVGNYIQIGFLFTGEPLKMNLNKLNPVQGFKRIFSLRAIVELLKSSLKFAIVAVVAWTTLWGEKDELLSLSNVPLEDTLRYAARVTTLIGMKIGAVLVVLAILDYLYQRYDLNKQLRMSKQELKDEFKKTEGDPLIKSRIREKQRRMAMARMMQEVPKADVVITNPTHYAVALQYDATTMDEPKVIAKGVDYIALKIREVAEAHGIITMENRPLARALYEQVEIGQSIPAELFQAVAEVLAYVYKVKGKRL
jgi:flagellar biosynthetic protein FlhB